MRRFVQRAPHLLAIVPLAQAFGFVFPAASFDGTVLTLDYSDSGKFGGSHQFPETRERQLTLLKAAVMEVCGVAIEIEQRP